MSAGILAQRGCMKKLFMLPALPALREARKKLAFVMPVDDHDDKHFRAAKALLRSRRGFGRKLGAVIR